MDEIGGGGIRRIVYLFVVFVMIVLCFFGCKDNLPSLPAEAAPTELVQETAITENTKPPQATQTETAQSPQSTPGNMPFAVSEGTQVYLSEEELAPILPLFDNYLENDEFLYYAVSTNFNNEPFVIGFIYELDDYTLPFRCVVGLRQTQGGFDEAFVSKEYDNPRGFIAEYYGSYSPNQLEVFEHEEYIVVKANDNLNPDVGLHTFFVINESGLQSNYITTSFTDMCEMVLYDNKLLLISGFIWYEFDIENNEIVLHEITDFSPYLPKANQDDYVVSLQDYQSQKFNPDTQEYYGENFIFIEVNGEEISIDDFDKVQEDAGWGPFWVYICDKSFVMKKGRRLIFTYPPGIKIEASIYNEENAFGYIEPIYTLLPGSTFADINKSGQYEIHLSSRDEFYIISITVED